MAFPVDNTLVNLTGRFGPRTPIRLPNGKVSGGFHYGVDLAPEVPGATLLVYAVGRAVVHSTGRRSDAGLFIIIRTADNALWRYCHLSQISVSPGQTVADGQPIGRMGTTGNSTGVHLHLEVYPNNQLSTRVDPLPRIWNERNPARSDTGTPTPAPAPSPTPAPAPSGGGVQVGSTLRLTGGWVGYTYSQLSGRQPALLPSGDYRVVGIANGNFRVQGNGRDAWVKGSAAAAGLVSGSAPAPAPTPAPAPAPAPAPSRGVVVGSTLRLTGGWVGFTQSNLTGRQNGLLPTGNYRVVGIANGNFRVQGNGRDAWVKGTAAAAGLI